MPKIEFYEFLKPHKGTINTLRNLHKLKQTFAGCPQEFYYRFMYIAPSSDHSMLTPHLPFNVILRKFEVVFWCLEWECCTFQKIYDFSSFKSTNGFNVTSCKILLLAGRNIKIPTCNKEIVWSCKNVISLFMNDIEFILYKCFLNKQ